MDSVIQQHARIHGMVANHALRHPHNEGGCMEPAIYISFLVRLWREQHSEQIDADWHGEIEHIHSGACWCFDTLGAALHFLERAAEEPGAARLDTDTPTEE
jgi:hypothetical protein